MIKFARMMADEFDDNSVHRSTLKQLIHRLDDLYELTRGACVNDQMKRTCRELCLLYTSLESSSTDGTFRSKPKLHQLQELVEFVPHGCPRSFWSYYDEHWGAWLAKAGSRRGGRKGVTNVATTVIFRFRCATADTL